MKAFNKITSQKLKKITEVVLKYFKNIKKSQPLLLKTITFSVLILLALNIVFLFFQNHKQSIELVNTKKIIADFTNSVANAHINSDQKIALVKNFNVIYPKLLDQYANQHHVIIFDNLMILAEPNTTVNVTSIIEKKLSEKSIRYLKNNLSSNKKYNSDEIGDEP